LLAVAVQLNMARYTNLYAIQDQGSKTGWTFISDCCNRRRR